MRSQQKRILIWSIAVAGFAGALVGSAFLGIAMAKRDLPQSALESAGEPYPLEIIVTVEGEEEPIFFSPEVQMLRDYWFANPSPEQRVEAESRRDGVQKLEGSIYVRTLRQDADVMEVYVLTGNATGRTGWIHLCQLPPQP